LHAGVSVFEDERGVVQNQFRVEVAHVADAIVVRLVGELDVASSPVLERALEELVGVDAGVVVLDLRELEFMDSTGLRAVLVAHQAASDAGRRFGLVKGPEQVQRLLSLTQVADRLVIADSPEEFFVAG
jgi:anti-anti-sigma factor